MNGFTGTTILLRLALRRDRIQLPVWLAVLTGVLAASAGSVLGLYQTEAARHGYATTTSASVVARAFNGPPAGPDLGAIVMVETYVTTAVLLVLMSIFAVVRHTRQNEETGRAELIGSGVIGRHAQLTAAVIIAVLADLAFGGLAFAVLVGSGLPVTGSALLGAGLAGTGIAFVGVAAVTAQVAESSRAANGLASAVLGLSFLVRAVGDALGEVAPDGLSVASAWPSWASPLGWSQQVKPYHDDTAWPLLLPLAFFAVLFAAAYVLTTRRDIGTGLVPVRPGPPVAARWLLSPLGLAWRLQRGTLYGWAAGLLVTGAVLGAVADEIDNFTSENEAMAELLKQLGQGADDLLDAYLGGMLGLVAVAVGAYLVQALLRLRGEEASGHLEPVLATAVSRWRWLASHLLCAVAGAAVLLLLSGAAAGAAYGLISPEPSAGVLEQTVRTAGAALVWLPASLALGGFAVAAFGLVPRLASGLSWGALTICMLMGQIGALLELPQAVLNISPFTHVPAVPAVELTALPLVLLTGAALLLGGIGVIRFQRRDLALS